MAKELVWNIIVDDMPYVIKLVGNKVIVNNSEPIKYTKLKKAVGEGKGANYELPVGYKTAILRISSYAAPVLTLDGRDCSTGEFYEAPKMPWWVWIHVVIHALGFVFLIGGAIGGAIQGGVIMIMMSVSAQKQKSTIYRVAVCTGILFVSLIAQFLLAYFILTTFGI
ncbi:MAG: hypothetical protein IKK33_12960 [Lachnospiraceae bacterium]|nr:hypothetical protein [Lachnospiraceae bacterium]